MINKEPTQFGFNETETTKSICSRYSNGYTKLFNSKFT